MPLKDLIAPFYVWKRAFEKPYTAAKPIEERPGAPRYRGFHTNDMELCIGCGTCETICQNEAIDMVPVPGIETTAKDSGLRPMVDNGRCCWCALCVDICTTGSLRLTNEYICVDTDPDSFRFIPGTGDNPWDDKELGYRRDPGYRLLDYERQDMDMHAPEQSLQSFMEVMKGYSAEQAKKEADRCVDCGICVATCPAHMDIPDYIKAVRDGDFERGLQLLYRTNPFPATCGRICTRRCEDVCSVGHLGDPVAIRWLKRYIADQVPMDQYSAILEDEADCNGKSVAIVGAGPGGLSAAYYLGKLGYKVTIYESQEKAGGMLRYGVPSYRLPYDQLDKDVDYILSLGGTIHYGTRVGQDIAFSDLMEGFDAVFFSTGLTESYDLGIEGESHPRVLSGLKVLDDVTNDKDPGVGKRVAVIGGGNVAMDVARVSRRYGADVTILYRRRIEDMPADPEEIHEAQDEKVKFVTQAIPIRVEEGPTADQVNIRWGEAEMVSDSKGGRPRPMLIEDKIHLDTYDSIVAAIGQGGDFDFLTSKYAEEVELKRGKVVCDDHRQTGIPKLFVGGDIANKTADAISAIADGHQAAIGIDRFLS
jgi:glutamate synthase (NADPH) small chain